VDNTESHHQANTSKIGEKRGKHMLMPHGKTSIVEVNLHGGNNLTEEMR
jgi:hypothetical protein